MPARERYTLIGILSLTALVFGPFAADYFWLDDVAWIKGAEQASSLWQWTMVPGDTFPYRPLTAAAFALLGPVCGCDPLPYRVLGIGLHLVNVALAFVLARRLTGDDRAALAGAALWAIYPAHRWAVLWIADLAGLAAAMFSLVCLLAYWRYRIDGAARRWLVLSLACFALAVLAKETYITVALVVLLMRAAGRGGPAWPPGSRLGEIQVPGAESPYQGALQSTTRAATQGRPYVRQGMRAFGAEALLLLLAFLLSLPIAYAYNLRPGEGTIDLISARYPANLARAMLFMLLPGIDPNAINGFGNSLRENLTVIALAAPAALAWLALLWRARSRRAWLLSLWAPVLLLPVLITPFFLLPFKGRYLYFPSLGFCLLLGVLWRKTEKALRGRATGGFLRHVPAAGLALLVLSLALFNTQQQWWVRNPERPAQLLQRYVWSGLLGCPATPGEIRSAAAREGVGDWQRAVDAPLPDPAQRTYLTSLAARALARELAGDTAGARVDAEAARVLALRGDFDVRDKESFYLIPRANVLAYLDAQLARLAAGGP